MSLPTPEQERKAILAVFAFGILGVLGAVAVVTAAGIAIGRLAVWVFA